MSLIDERIRKLCKRPEVTCANCQNPECCWAHLPFFDAGMGQKCDDYFGAPLCMKCHDYADDRATTDAHGHRASTGGRHDYEWKYRVLRRGIALLFEAGIIGTLGGEQPDVIGSSLAGVPGRAS